MKANFAVSFTVTNQIKIMSHVGCFEATAEGIHLIKRRNEKKTTAASIEITIDNLMIRRHQVQPIGGTLNFFCNLMIEWINSNLSKL